MRERKELLADAMTWMHRRAWRRKLAKRRGREQSLFEHTLTELDVLLELLPILSASRHYGLSEEEQQILIAAVVCHDVGKESDEWQQYVLTDNPSTTISHIDSELTATVIPEIRDALQLEIDIPAVLEITRRCADFHHNVPGRSNGAILEAMLVGGTDRFIALATIVQGIDRVCSATDISSALNAIDLNRSLGNHLVTAAHQIVVRGVSSTYLHRAAQLAYKCRGWSPLLFFPDGTVYVAAPGSGAILPDRSEIAEQLKAGLSESMRGDIVRLMVGSPTANILPKPELFEFAEVRHYLKSAASKIGPLSFAKKKEDDRRKVVEAYFEIKQQPGQPTSLELETQTGRISRAQPEMVVFKFFKAMLDPAKLPEITNEAVEIAKARYGQIFGPHAWDSLQSTSTLMAARDMHATVDPFWELSGERVGHPEVTRVAELPDDVRVSVLIDILGEIADATFSAVPSGSPRTKLAGAMADAFLDDLFFPPPSGVVPQLAAETQLLHYSQSKPNAGKDSKKGVYLCPICNMPFGAATKVKAKADIIDKPQSHSNRGAAYGPFDYVMICQACSHERVLRQLLLGERASEIVSLTPHVNLGPAQGDALVGRVKDWVQIANAQMMGENGSSELGFNLSYTDNAARNIQGRDPCGATPSELLTMFSCRVSTKVKKDRHKFAEKRLAEEFDGDLALMSEACGRDFTSWDEAAAGLVEGSIRQQDVLLIRREVFRKFSAVMTLVCQTPNLVFIPLTDRIGLKDESDASCGLRRLYVALVLSLALDAKVAIHGEGEPAECCTGSGAAYVPPVPAIRSLITSSWISLSEAEKWLNAIGAASLLSGYTKLPPRNALYQTLSAKPAEKLARRIEVNGEKTLSLGHFRLIEQLPFFRSSN